MTQALSHEGVRKSNHSVGVLVDGKQLGHVDLPFFFVIGLIELNKIFVVSKQGNFLEELRDVVFEFLREKCDVQVLQVGVDLEVGDSNGEIRFLGGISGVEERVEVGQIFRLNLNLATNGEFVLVCEVVADLHHLFINLEEENDLSEREVYFAALHLLFRNVGHFGVLEPHEQLVGSSLEVHVEASVDWGHLQEGFFGVNFRRDSDDGVLVGREVEEEAVFGSLHLPLQLEFESHI